MKQSLSNFSLKKRAKTFYFASLFFSKAKQFDIKKLYLFCRFIDDLGDSSLKNNKASIIKLNKIKKELKDFKSADPVVSGFIYLMKKYNISHSIPNDLINGVLSDFKKVDIKNYNQLYHYSYKVAGTVGLMMCKIMDVQKESSLLHGVQLGIAMQLTNIARDIKEDLLKDRIYFPKEIRKNVKKNFIHLTENKKLQVRFSEDLESFLSTADQIYSLAWRGIIGLPIKYKIPIAIASYLYQSIGIKIRENKYDIWSKRIYLTHIEKIIKTIKILIKLFFYKRMISNKVVANKLNKTLNNIYSNKCA